MKRSQQPTLFLSHGSPMTALGGDPLSAVWTQLATRLDKPSAIVMVSAHWTTSEVMVGGSVRPQTIHDFGGFPEELYTLAYPAPGAPELAGRIAAMLNAAGVGAGVGAAIEATIDKTQGLDHGAWVPLRALFPAADVPVLQVSVQPGRDARHHLALGAALAPLRDDNVLVVGSGHLTHNLGEYLRGRPRAAQSVAFRDWVHARLLAGDIDALADWEHQAPHARFAHPSVEHFLPLFVALGAAGPQMTPAWLGGGWEADVLAADNYLFSPH